MNHRNLNKHCRKIVFILSCCLAFLLTIAAYLHFADTPSPPTSDIATPSIEKNPNSIAIPGYEVLELSADSKAQTLCFSNPEQNMCYFQISLYLEDGTLLWQSELIEPGKISKPVVLIKKLSKGTYPKAILRYDCYRTDENFTPLNGAETKVTLRVK